jgi:F0F1-type ATP synthase assembly protein I
MGRQLVQLLVLQGAITTVVAAGLFAWGSPQTGMAALFGGGTAAMAALGYGVGYWVLGVRSTSSPLRRFLVAESCRVFTAVVLLWLGMVSLSGEALIAYLGAFVAALLAYLLVFLFFRFE